MSLVLPGWTCRATDRTGNLCRAFNGAAKEWLTHCRACGYVRPEPENPFTHSADECDVEKPR